MRWWQGFRARRAAASAARGIGAGRIGQSAAPGETSAGAARPPMLRTGRLGRSGGGLPVTRGITLQRSARAGRGTLTRAPEHGPDVRPGHELPMRPAAIGGGVGTAMAPGAAVTMQTGTAQKGTAQKGATQKSTTSIAGTPSGPGTPTVAGPGVTTATGTAAPAIGQTVRSTITRSAKQGIATGTAPLAERPEAGPSVSNPNAVGYLRVLGAAPLPPGSEPDPTGAVSVSPSPRSGPAASPRPGPGTRPVGQGETSPARVPAEVSPRRRWEEAVRQRPLEAPRALPTGLHAMAAALTGRSRPPLYTTGPNTRHALGAAGALGATTGTVVHLPRAPTPGPSVSAVLAHELTHTRNPVRRPRFFLGGGLSSLLDDDERSALAAGARNAVSGATSQASGLVGQGRQAAAGLIGQGRAAVGDATSAASGLLGQGRQMADGLIGQGRQALSGAQETAAGIVDQLPVGAGFGAVGDMATRAARAAVLEAGASPLAGASGMLDQAQGMASGVMDSASGALSSVSGYADQAAGAANGLVGQASGAVNGFLDQASGAANGLVDQATSAASGAVSAVAGAAQGLDPDKVVEIVEQRLLREIERRGGRWAGVF